MISCRKDTKQLRIERDFDCKLSYSVYFCRMLFNLCGMKRALLLILLLSGIGAGATENKPKLLVGIVVNHFYPEWLEWYKKDLSEGGFKRLITQGAALEMDYRYMYSQTGVDHASIYTGLFPSEHGIVSHVWYDRLRKRRQGAVESSSYQEIGVRRLDSLKSCGPDYLQAITLGSAMKMYNAFSKVYGVAMNAEDAVLSAGCGADMALWFCEKTGKWISSTYYREQLPSWLTTYNEQIESDFLVNKGWMSLANELSKSRVKSKYGEDDFYYDIARAKKNYNTYRVLKATPHANRLVRYVAEKLIEGEQLGKDNDPDLLALNFSCLDYMYRDFTVDSKEGKDLFLRLDWELEILLNYLDMKVGKGNYSVFLTFSETRELTPQDLEKVKVNSHYFSIFKAVALLKSYLGLLYGAGDWIVDYDQGQIYLNRPLIEKSKLDLKEIQDRVADFLIEFEGVAKAITAYSLTHMAYSSGTNQLIQNAFSHKRSGDVLFSLNPMWISELKEMEDMYFRHSKRSVVPLYIYGCRVYSAVDQVKYCNVVDLLPMLSKMLEIPCPYTVRKNR